MSARFDAGWRAAAAAALVGLAAAGCGLVLGIHDLSDAGLGGGTGTGGTGTGGTGTGGTGTGGTGTTTTPTGPVTLASGQADPTGVAVDANNVYWANANDGTVMKVPIAGGTPTMIAANQFQPTGIAADGVNVYWCNYDPNGTLAQTVEKVAVSGVGEGPIASNQNCDRGIVTDGKSVFWLNSSGTVRSVPVSGGTPVDLATGPTGQNETGDLALAAGFLYWTTDTQIMRVPVSGGGGSPFVTATVGSPSAITTDGTSIYWSSILPGGVSSALLGGGAPATMTPVAPQTNSSFGIAVDTTDVYWTDKNGDVWKAPRGGGGTPAKVAPTDTAPTWGIAVDASNVYWTVPANGLVMKRAK